MIVAGATADCFLLFLRVAIITAAMIATRTTTMTCNCTGITKLAPGNPAPHGRTMLRRTTMTMTMTISSDKGWAVIGSSLLLFVLLFVAFTVVAFGTMMVTLVVLTADEVVDVPVVDATVDTVVAPVVEPVVVEPVVVGVVIEVVVVGPTPSGAGAGCGAGRGEDATVVVVSPGAGAGCGDGVGPPPAVVVVVVLNDGAGAGAGAGPVSGPTVVMSEHSLLPGAAPRPAGHALHSNAEEPPSVEF